MKRRTALTNLIGAGCVAAAYPHVGFGQSSETPIKVGQIGTTHPHAAGKLASIRSLPELYEVVGVVEPDEARWSRIRSEKSYQGVPRISEHQLLNDSSVQAIAVETKVVDLVPTAMRCIQAGKHIHLDKPAGESLQACEELHRTADAAGLTIQMGYMLRYNPAFQRLFKIVKQGWLGQITELSGAMGKKAGDSTRQELAQFKGGGMFELACHLIDAMVTVLGKPNRVTAHNRVNHPDRDRMIDNQLAVFDYETTLATIRCNHIDPFGSPRRYFEVIGEHGSFRINPLEPPKAELSLDQPRGEFKKGTQSIAFPRPSGRYDAEFHDLAKVIRGEKKLAWDSAHDIIVHETVLRASGVRLDVQDPAQID